MDAEKMVDEQLRIALRTRILAALNILEVNYADGRPRSWTPEELASDLADLLGPKSASPVDAVRSEVDRVRKERLQVAATNPDAPKPMTASVPYDEIYIERVEDDTPVVVKSCEPK